MQSLLELEIAVWMTLPPCLLASLPPNTTGQFELVESLLELEIAVSMAKCDGGEESGGQQPRVPTASERRAGEVEGGAGEDGAGVE